MEKEIVYQTKGTCSKEIGIKICGDSITNVTFAGGCHGNLQGICKLVEGMKITDVIEKLKGIDCKGRGTSCPDQLTQALKDLA